MKLITCTALLAAAGVAQAQFAYNPALSPAVAHAHALASFALGGAAAAGTPLPAAYFAGHPLAQAMAPAHPLYVHSALASLASPYAYPMAHPAYAPYAVHPAFNAVSAAAAFTGYSPASPYMHPMAPFVHPIAHPMAIDPFHPLNAFVPHYAAAAPAAEGQAEGETPHAFIPHHKHHHITHTYLEHLQKQLTKARAAYGEEQKLKHIQEEEAVEKEHFKEKEEKLEEEELESEKAATHEAEAEAEEGAQAGEPVEEPIAEEGQTGAGAAEHGGAVDTGADAGQGMGEMANADSPISNPEAATQ